MITEEFVQQVAAKVCTIPYGDGPCSQHLDQTRAVLTAVFSDPSLLITDEVVLQGAYAVKQTRYMERRTFQAATEVSRRAITAALAQVGA